MREEKYDPHDNGENYGVKADVHRMRLYQTKKDLSAMKNHCHLDGKSANTTKYPIFAKCLAPVSILAGVSGNERQQCR